MKNNIILIKCLRHINWIFRSIWGYCRFVKILDNETYVFISHNADSAGGAPVVLFELIRNIKDEKVIFLSKKPGKILDLCKENNIPAFSSYLFHFIFLKTIEYKKPKKILINTITLANTVRFFNRSNYNKPIFWWIHEDTNLISKYSKNLDERIKDNIKILCVSSKVKDDLIIYKPEYKDYIDIFYYCCKDLYKKDLNIKRNLKRYKITCIGRICSRKNQIQIIEAYNLLPEQLKSNIYIELIAASSDKDYMNKLRNSIKDNSRIKIVGPIERNKMLDIYYDSDLIVCSSIDDPLPVVITEAMMLRCLYITTTRTGHFKLIKNEVNGFTYDVNNTAELTQCIIKAYNMSIEEKEILKDNARLTYIKNFSPENVLKKFYNLTCNSRSGDVKI